MNEALYPFISIVGFFILLLVMKKFLKFEFCLFCASIFLTWFIFLLLYYLDKFNNLTLIALLMGGSAVGLVYLLERKLEEKFLIFKLPFYLSLIAIALMILTGNVYIELIIFIVIIWLFFILIFLFQNNEIIKKVFQTILNCCKNW
jgi:hypothetical protein